MHIVNAPIGKSMAIITNKSYLLNEWFETDEKDAGEHEVEVDP